MSFSRNSSGKSRYERLRDGEVPERPVRGAGLRIEYENGRPAAVLPVEHSMVLHLEPGWAEDGRRRRLRLVEWFGGEEAPSYASRHVADLFAIDSDTLDFARTAMREKIERDSHVAIDIFQLTRFEINRTDVEFEGFNTTLVLTCWNLDGVGFFNLRIPLESSDYETQVRGHSEFSQLCAILGLRVVEDSDILVGRRATVIHNDTGGLVFAPIRFEMVAA